MPGAGAGEVPQQPRQAPSRIVVRNEGLGMAVGSRSHLENEALAKRSWYRNFLMRGFHLLVLSVAGGAVRDTQCGFKVSYLGIPLPDAVTITQKYRGP